jgi:hypothetical protein
VRADGVLRVDVPQNPSSSVEVDGDGPSVRRTRAIRSKDAELDIWTIGLVAVDRDVPDAAHGQLGATAWNQGARGSRSRHGLQVHLLLIYDMLIVEFDVCGVQSIPDGFVKGIWWLRASLSGRSHAEEAILLTTPGV